MLRPQLPVLISLGCLSGLPACGRTGFGSVPTRGSDPDEGDRFGGSLSMEAGTLVVGAYLEAGSARDIDGDPYDNTAPQAGAVYIFEGLAQP